jgi:hypothetical protein
MASKLEILEKEQKTKREKFITKKTVRYLGVWCSIGFFLFSLGLGYYSDRAAVLILGLQLIGIISTVTHLGMKYGTTEHFNDEVIEKVKRILYVCMINLPAGVLGLIALKMLY